MAATAIEYAVLEALTIPKIPGEKSTSDCRTKYQTQTDLKIDALQWFFCPDSSFPTFCGWLGLDPDVVQQKVVEKLNNQQGVAT